MSVLVTGATGHIGNVLVRTLLNQGKTVKVLVLPNDDLTPLKGLPVEIIMGNILQKTSLITAFQGVEIVYHLAGIVSIESGNRNIIYQVNVSGTKNVIAACLATGVRRMVYTSSIHALAIPPLGTLITEKVPFLTKNFRGNYNWTKALASQAIQKSINENNLDAVLVCPTGVIGPFDFKISQIGQLIKDFTAGRLKAYLEGGYDYVDVRDVAQGIIAAGEKGKKGEIYILSGEKISVKKMLQIIEKETGIKAPTFKIPHWLALITTPFSYLYYKLLKQRPLFTSYSIRTLSSNADISHEKANRDLGYNPRSVEESLKDQIAWMKYNNVLTKYQKY